MPYKITAILWEVAALRLTAFMNITQLPNTDDWWKVVVGSVPELVTQERQKAQIKYESSYDTGKLILNFQPTRADWIYEAIEKPSEPQSRFVTIGQFEPKTDIFRSMMNQWLSLEDLPPVKRLAFGAVLLFPVSDAETGYVHLSKLLPFELDAQNSSDFSYQINRKRLSLSGIPDLTLNRFSKWSVLKMQTALIRSDFVSGQVSVLPEVYACHLELDINTVPNFEGVLSKDKLQHLFDELVNLGQEIAREGDIP